MSIARRLPLYFQAPKERNRFARAENVPTSSFAPTGARSLIVPAWGYKHLGPLERKTNSRALVS
jgi:hypothetical protein